MPLDIARILRETFVDQVEHHRVLTSTNDRAARCARERAIGLPLVVVADQQTAGRGRGTNDWWTGRGSLALSLLVSAELLGGGRQRSPLVALASAMAVVDTVGLLLPGHWIGIRWPNDVLVDDALVEGRKVAGILVEVLPDQRHIIGIGVNTNNTLADAPPELRATACTIRELMGCEHNQTDILISLLQCLERSLSQLRTSPAALAVRADALCVQHNRVVTVENGETAVAGRCQGIGPDGALLLDTPTGVQSFVSGVVRYS